MVYCWLWASAALAALGAAAEVVTTTRQFEVDIVFPHNETYKPAETMPIVLAIQNPAVALSIGHFSVFWTISQVQGWDTIGSSVDFGDFQVFSNLTSTDPTLFLVGFTNVTDWIRYGRPTPPATEYTPGPHDRYLLQWSIVWTSLFGNCTKFESLVGADLPSEGAVAFNIQTVWGEGGWQGEIHDVQEGIPECPEFGGLVQIGPPPNATKPACPGFEILEGREGNPCAVTIDQPAASSIWSRVSTSVASSMSRYHPTPTTTAAVESSTSSGGVGPARTMQTALAAACVLCGLAL
ncbi:predicted protein [Chaetomium globosum CBS 148.51]|uniref:DUF7136 domain-containing protein n=1 Tax=Chaetomium globosum (strain ATCC 6205 / CBS 148.51 / DSM 1962 / NBRC 6347 / NRRL 1970) TaxID=306901 RepID=Q2HHV4_CHAGB|nr:uncharacterized protein CHGG_00200 [Chaetomium globosum CBS 148.51]EAQ91965.1 predicted protein [Chaetomium globosum CBS 148.51]